MSRKKFKVNIQNPLSLRMKHIAVSNDFIVISSYNRNSIKISEENYKLPLCILKNNIFKFHVNSTKSIEVNSIIEINDKFLDIFQTYPEVILMGLVKTNLKSFLVLKEKCFKKSLPLDIMNFDAACRTFNVLSTEQRMFAAIFM